ncbi:hypothetical protein Pint_32115 [Pistacia integerrima]|uniref:Uncharacterized protein n=1 Tax=Pistacia integerrima TaxID=434235 RepID=A0ACC0XTN7_9ROSI|nr:hypothetical protein Pint_32115 [Pistacia integerrima]
MNREKVHHACTALSVLVVSVFLFCLLHPVACLNAQNLNYNKISSDLIYKSIANITTIIKSDVTKHLGFCIVDEDNDWNEAFNFSKNTDFLATCAKKTKGDMAQRLCSAAEMKFYFSNFYAKEKAPQPSTKISYYLKPNKNCNLTSWVSGCEPGWACSSGDENIDRKNTKDMPIRTDDCQPCCEGFFCPKGLTCMMRKILSLLFLMEVIVSTLFLFCILPLWLKLVRWDLTALLQNSIKLLVYVTQTICRYSYQLPHGQPNHTCGGADVWADIGSSTEVFCSAGSYCPSTSQKIPCSSGHYCRLGSTSQEQCFRLATCHPNSTTQNITAYGILLFGGLSILLLIIYSCSDQVLATREKRQAKSREKAVQSVRETAQAREKWKSAKEIARKRAVDLQTQLSRTFSRRKSLKQLDPLKSLGHAKPGTDAALSSMSMAAPPLPASKHNKKEKRKLTEMLNEIEDNPDSQDGFNLEIGDKNIKRHTPKGKQLHTQSQMFRYAYGQIEKEKAMQEENKNLTYSGVISMTNEIDIRKRPAIEVAFKDLTITLKGKNKHLMRCVTGKLSPGRVSAVMGPSGAGKTTFLSALSGKVPGCTMSGMILVNGKVESIQSYKKIIGFVPQDDIVHGNLTVEENLWFSASCRLAADLPKPEKVLVVERVIESLGLQHVRDSLVGTVEKRGISGGQRKRVNVGLEMVMEPSLLILDEPTSGLDSSSSQLLLRALRREALEGVNICMVVHQPSYTLYRMFDDLILLAKGGLTVYHGSVKKVEEYFSRLGITVPDRVNPPDYFIDILEGILKPSTSSGVNYKQLPIRWMLHNGYSVPIDMLRSAEGIEASAENMVGGNISDGSEAHSFAGDFWEDVKCSIQVKRDSLEHNFLSSGDLSLRRTPDAFQQYRYFLGRAGKQRLREARTQAVDYLILLLAGICLGTLAKVSDETFGATGYTYTVIAVSLLCKIAALRSFSLDKLHYWRESASGMSSLAYFLAKDTVDHFNTLIKPLVYLSMFYFFNNPRSSVVDNYLVLLCLVYCVTGIAYVLAICFEPGPAQLWSVLLPVVLTLVANQNEANIVIEKLSNLCYTKWAMEAFVIANAKRFDMTTLHNILESG